MDVRNDLWILENNANWKFLTGSQVVNDGGTSTLPAARGRGCFWLDDEENLWLFGGIQNSDDAYVNDKNFNDLWKFSGSWKLIGGDRSASNINGSYGILGVASTSNWPSARSRAAFWKDFSGNFWMFGGISNYSIPRSTILFLYSHSKDS